MSHSLDGCTNVPQQSKNLAGNRRCSQTTRSETLGEQAGELAFPLSFNSVPTVQMVTSNYIEQKKVGRGTFVATLKLQSILKKWKKKYHKKTYWGFSV
jgi:hypothetical protein